MMLALVLLLIPFNDSKAIHLSLNGDYEASDVILKKSKESAAVNFYRLVNAFKLNKKVEVEKLSNVILNGFGIEYPQRYLDLAFIMQAEASTWKDDFDDLEDISREMGKATDRLKNNKGGPQTQKIQQDILNRLDKMIKDAEDKQNAAAKAAAKAEEDARAEALEKFRKELGQQDLNPADTVRGNDQGTGKVDRKKVLEIAAMWGKLPEKERASALRELTRNMPDKDRAVMEAYFKELQRRR